MPVAERVSEDLVVDLWERQLFESGALNEHGLTVVHRGFPSESGGPDYRDVLLADARGNMIRGDVEFHVSVSDWYAHGHQRDPAYNGVVLHVVWEDDGRETRNATGAPVLTVALGPWIDERGLASTRPLTLAPHRCLRVLSGYVEQEARDRIRAAGVQRLHDRADLLREEISACGPDQTLYAGLLEALGFACNREPFRLLAEAVPLALLAHQSPPEITDTLLAAAGFAAGPVAPPPARLPIDVWRLNRIRPANHPSRRIGAVGPLLARFGRNFSDSVVDALLGCARPRDLPSLFTVTADRDAPIGDQRAREIVASVALPFAHAVTGDARILDLYFHAPAPPPTRWTRAFLDLLPYHFRVRSAAEHQGIHAQYVGACRMEGSTRCRFCGSLGSSEA